MTALLLHLSDIHIRSNDDAILVRAESIASCLYADLPEAMAVILVISGDIAHSGTTEQYACAEGFLRKLREAISKERAVPLYVVTAPGNHDCDFSKDNALRRVAIKAVAENGPSEIDESIIAQCTAVQDAFFEFQSRIEQGNSVSGDRLCRTTHVKLDDITLTFHTLNVSWVSQLHEEQGALIFPHERYASADPEPSEVRFVVMHHPLNWFSQGVYRSFRTWVRELAHILITGHEHIGNVGENIDAESAHSVYIEGCALQTDGALSTSSFNVTVINTADREYRSTRFAWNGVRYSPTEEGSWTDYRDLPAKQRNPLEVTNDFRRVLEDPGAYFVRPTKARISLQDIFVYPDLRDLARNVNARNLISASALLDPSKTAQGVLLEGEEKVGCTTLLYRLYQEYHDRGWVPLLIRGPDIKHAAISGIEKLIRKAVVEQYGDNSVCAFDQYPSSKKLLLLDDFDDAPIKSAKARAEALLALTKRFGHVVVTVAQFFEFAATAHEVEEQPPFRDFAHYRVQPFGYALRGKLIHRWYALGNDGAVDDVALLGRYDQAERLTDAVMARSIVPSLPLYLLTLLQSLEAGRSGDFKDSALGFYYEYLLTQGFLSSGIPRNKLGEFFEYCTQLAWYFHQSTARELSETELRAFNRKFSDKWHTVDFAERIARLLEARVLAQRGEFFEFRYPYAYYFLKGRYITLNLHDTSIREYVSRCCSHLYARDNANTILFVAHHTNSEFVLKCILEALRRPFSKETPMTLGGDTDEIGALVRDAPQLTFRRVAPELHRQEVNALKDRVDDGNDGLLDNEEAGDELSLFAQLTTLFKTVEILGQVMKNQYARIERSKKVAILDELFCAPLRALSGFYRHVKETPTYLVSEIETALSRSDRVADDQRSRIARQIVSSIVQLVSFGFIYKAASSVSAETLREDISAAVSARSTPAYRIIEVATLLDAQVPIPRRLIEQLRKDIERNPLALRLLQMFALHHLYMFRTNERDKQWLASKLGLDLEAQRAVSFAGRSPGKRL